MHRDRHAAAAARPGAGRRADRLGRRRARRRAAASRSCRSSSTPTRTFGRIDLADLMDLQQTRPTVHLVDGVSREIDWPEITLSAGRLGRDVVLCSGPEPSLRWRAVLGELVDVALQLGVTEAFTVGRHPGDGVAPPSAQRARHRHRRSARRAGGRVAPGLHRPHRRAERAAGDARRRRHPRRSRLWAQVPHYLAGGASPPAIRAVLERLRDLGGARRRPRRARRAGRTPTCTGSKKVCPTVPTCVEVIDAIEAGEDEVDESRAAERRRARLGDRALPPRPVVTARSRSERSGERTGQRVSGRGAGTLRRNERAR